MKLEPIDIDSVEKTPKRWFEPIKLDPKVCHAVYLYPLGGFPDKIDKTGHESIW